MGKSWEQRKLGMISSLLTGFPFNSEEYSKEGIQLIRGTNVKRGYLDLSKGESVFWLSECGYEKYLLASEDIVVQMDGALIGKSYAKLNPNHIPSLLVQRVTRIRSLPEFSISSFLYSSLQNNFERYIDTLKTNTAVPHLSLKDIANYPVFMPSLQEQKSIGQFFENFDNLITLHHHQLDLLKEQKKGLLQKLFPKDGSNVPELRFPEFTAPWEQRKLGQIVQITMGQSPDGSTYSETPSDYILIQGNADLLNGWVNPRIWTTQLTKIAEPGDLIMSVRAPAGAMGKTSYKAVIGRGVAAIKGNEFLFQLLSKMDSEGFWKPFSSGSTFESLNSEDIKKAPILLPSLSEQEEIGSFFSNFDNLITLHQHQLDLLKEQKKGLLQKMFPKEGALEPELRFPQFK